MIFGKLKVKQISQFMKSSYSFYILINFKQYNLEATKNEGARE